MCWNLLSFKFKRIRNGNQKSYTVYRSIFFLAYEKALKRIKLETLKKAKFCYCTRYI